jgi:hypothetical protein
MEFLQTVGVTNANRYKRTGWVISACPLGPWNHENGKSSPEVFGVKIENGDPHCSCFACGYHGTLGSLAQRMIGLNKVQPRIEAKWGHANQLVWEAEETQEFDFDIPGIEDVLAAKKEGLHEFPAWWLGGFPPAWDVAWARDYLQSRDVPLIVAAALDIRCDPDQRRVCFPVRDFGCKLVGLHGRALDENAEPRYRMYTHAKKNNPIAWLGENWIDLTKPIVVVEGPFDLANVKRVYDNVASPLFATPSFDKLKRMSDALEWITLFDRGAGGDAGRARVTKALREDHVIHHLHPPKGRKDPGEMKVAELTEILSPLVPLTAFSSCKVQQSA